MSSAAFEKIDSGDLAMVPLSERGDILGFRIVYE